MNLSDLDLIDFAELDIEILEDKFYTLYKLLIDKGVITKKEFVDYYISQLKNKDKK